MLRSNFLLHFSEFQHFAKKTKDITCLKKKKFLNELPNQNANRLHSVRLSLRKFNTMNRKEYLKSMLILGLSGKAIWELQLEQFNPPKKTLILAFGGAGCNVIEKINQLPANCDLICISSKEHPMPAKGKFIEFSDLETFRKMGLEHQKPSNFWKFIHQSQALSELNKHLIQNQYQRYVVVSTPGSGTGYGFSKLFFDWINKQEKETHFVASYPFSFEGITRKKVCDKIFRELPSFVQLQKFPLDYIRESHGDKSLKEGLDYINTRMANRILEICAG